MSDSCFPFVTPSPKRVNGFFFLPVTLTMFWLKILFLYFVMVSGMAYFQNYITIAIWQGVSRHGKPGKVMGFYFFTCLEKSWKLTPGFWKFIKVREIKRHPLAKQHCSFISSFSIQEYVYIIRSNFVHLPVL